ncbi:Glutaminyl-tRNA synthetase [Conoideocrella luteorostrata]|uniref:Glutaminyl-tRNA synthetase n=1 Tax=Conoideocrella luteorostrata TaxID=1105319 RepID=A0AAJ0CYA0_9HYPO|nr:Glutaminyl-tRNA synthetase [Conoideocrella luteorostrata]
MADAIAESTAKLQLDKETGEMVSKNELKKRLQKRAKKAAALLRNSRPMPAQISTTGDRELVNALPGKPAKTEEPSIDPDAMFKQGFLAEVYKLRPVENIVTRFPPEPNGYLHATLLSAADFLPLQQFDDTNPDAEREEYCIAIKETIRWLGFTPSEITYASDNFQRMYDLAEEMIRKGKAYVCHCNEVETKQQRGGDEGMIPRYRCEHAKQSVDTNIKKFRGMRDGEYAPQTAWLRMKQDIENPNP